MRASLRNLSLLATAVVIGLCAASSASAANVAPNPSFENECSGDPCQWTEIAPTVAWDNTTQYHGQASMRLSGQVGSDGGAARSDCIAPFPAGVSDGSFFHFSPSPGAYVSLTLVYFSGATCVGASTSETLLVPTSDSWQQASSAFTAPPGTQSAVGDFEAGCNPTCGSFSSFFDIWVDLVLVEPRPTAVALSSFAAYRSSRGVALSWSTSSEVETLGFNLYRTRGDSIVRLSKKLIGSVFGGTATGHAYSWLDRSAPRGAARYRLQAVSLSGKRSWVGSAAVPR